MRAERLFRFGGLALVLLFPLLSVLQLGDGNDPWHEAAERVRPSVLGLHRTDDAGGHFLAYGLVVEASPPRVVVPGRLDGVPLRSRHAPGWMRWRVLLMDVEGEFTVLQADGFQPDTDSSAPTDLADLVAAASVNPDPHGQPVPEVEVALVAPSERPDQPLWVGVLTAETSPTGRSTYTSSFLHPLEDSAALSTSSAHAASEVEVDSSLRGVPFVDAAGNAVAIFVGRDARGMHALALETVVQSLVMLHLQAAK
jgi:hypothetical protein